MNERRTIRRSRTYVAGQIVLNDRRSTMDCMVRNLSEAGAKLSIGDAVALPDVFDLSLVNKGSRFRVRTKWRSGEALGVAFVERDA